MFSLFLLNVFLFLIVALPILRGIELIHMLKICPKYNMKITRMNILGWQYLKVNGKWEKTFIKFSMMVDYLCLHNEISDEGNDEREAKMIKEQCVGRTIAGIVPLAIALGFYFANSNLRENAIFLMPLAIAVDMFILSIFFNLLVMNALKKKGTGMYGYLKDLAKQILYSPSFDMIQVKKISELPFDNINDSNRIRYYCLSLIYYVGIGDLQMISVVAHDLARIVQNRNFEVSSYPGCAIWLVFYYSRYEVNYEMATMFYNKLHKLIVSDPDANAKRALAYYHYAITKNIPLAKQYLNEGLACVDSFSMGLERELEKRLLNELVGFMEKHGF